MKILLTNDDGYNAKGIKVLEEVLSEYGHEVWVIAPSSNCSAYSHKMTVTGEITMTKFGANHYHCSGTPTDCVLYGSKAKFFHCAPDLVVSGINAGGNMSTDVLYSGTCAAACEAAMHDIKAVALSVEPNEKGEFNFRDIAVFFCENLNKFYPLINHHRFLNINAPYAVTEGVKVGRLGTLKYPDGMSLSHSDGDSMIYTLNPGGDARYQCCETEQTDFEIVKHGGIALTFVAVLPALDLEGQKALEAIYG